MSLIEVVCPSGLSGVVRGLKGRELDLFANKDAVRSRRVGGQVLSTCWTETKSLGPIYAEMAGGELDWDQVLVCDRFYTIFKIREATMRDGHKYAPSFVCSGTAGCGHHFESEFDLNDLDIFDLPEDSKAALLDGSNEFTFRMGDDVVVHRLLYGKDENDIERKKSMTPRELATTNLVARIVRVERPAGSAPTSDGDPHRGVSPAGYDKLQGAELRKWVRDLDYEDWLDVQHALEEVDGGIETEIRTMCPKCGNEMVLDLPLGADFLTPQRRGRSSQRKVRRKSRG